MRGARTQGEWLQGPGAARGAGEGGRREADSHRLNSEPHPERKGEGGAEGTVLTRARYEPGGPGLLVSVQVTVEHIEAKHISADTTIFREPGDEDEAADDKEGEGDVWRAAGVESRVPTPQLGAGDREILRCCCRSPGGERVQLLPLLLRLDLLAR